MNSTRWIDRLSWPNTIFLVTMHGVGAALLAAYLIWVGLSWPVALLFVPLAALTGICVTAGYHRLFAHATYEAHPLLRIFYLIGGAAAFENSALKWSMDHRLHHAQVDQEADPYNIRKGFWWAHIGWVFFKDDVKGLPAPDLERDLWVRLQDRWFIPLAIASGFLLPTALGALWGDAIGGFVVLGVLRILVVHHATFLVNSLAHTLGRRPYSPDESARDSFVTALLTLGEGYHNFHHAFPMDYRNGVRAYQYDPTKWWIRALSWVGLTRRLHRVPREAILRARWAVERRAAQRRARLNVELTRRIERLFARLHELAERCEKLAAEYQHLKARVGERLDEIRRQRREARRRLRLAMHAWKRLLREPVPAGVAA
jgi:stearoyl-CoA desaturase (delta-9 desaturase)